MEEDRITLHKKKIQEEYLRKTDGKVIINHAVQKAAEINDLKLGARRPSSSLGLASSSPPSSYRPPARSLFPHRKVHFTSLLSPEPPTALRALKPPRHHRHLSAAVANSSRVAPPDADLRRHLLRLRKYLGYIGHWFLCAESRRKPLVTVHPRVAKPGHHSVSPIHHRNTISSTQSGRRLSPSPATSNLAVAAVRSAASGRTSADPPSSPKVAGAPLPPLKVSPSLGLPSSFAGRRRSRLTASSLPPPSSPEERRRSRPSVRASRPLPLVDVPRRRGAALHASAACPLDGQPPPPGPPRGATAASASTTCLGAGRRLPPPALRAGRRPLPLGRQGREEGEEEKEKEEKDARNYPHVLVHAHARSAITPGRRELSTTARRAVVVVCVSTVYLSWACGGGVGSARVAAAIDYKLVGEARN
ncbi:hypothetical protein [Oryza sativa Japonica Group]|uniref:Uncharacterized protein n=1 Tax=Oryza sativa subsp. japonica TaxID=39947 RepID=Q5ZB66_ORYSJ|nr:hypothetical protein [Oryza sativa Japonica Group]